MLEKLFPSLKEGKKHQNPQLYLGQTKIVSQHLYSLRFFPIYNAILIIGTDIIWTIIQNKNILVSEKIRQKRLTILEYFDAYICHHYMMTNICIEIFQNCQSFLSHIFRKFLFFCQEEMAIGTDRPNILMKVFEDYIFYSLFGQPGFCLIFILSKNKVFQSGALLKMPPSSLFMKEFDQ